MRVLFEIICYLEYLKIIFFYKFAGISYVVSYLRNPNPNITVRILQRFGANVGNRTTIKRSLYLDNVYEDAESKGDLSNLVIGNNCYIGDRVYLDLSNRVLIGDNVMVSAGSSFITHQDVGRSSFLSPKFERISAPIELKNDIWICANATVLQGVVIEKDSVVAACSLVKDNMEGCSLYGGIPAKIIKKL